MEMGFSQVGARKRQWRRGQSSVEYLITAGMLVASVAILAVVLYTFRQYGGRVLDLVASEYP